MFKCLLCYLVFLSLTSAVAAQRNENPYFFSDTIRDTTFAINKSIQFKEYPPELLYAYNGNYKMALQIAKKRNDPMREYKALDSGLIKKYEVTVAKDFILKIAGDNKILIINEAHHNPSHRIFTMTLLGALKQLGYTHLSIEGLKRKKGDSVNLRGYPVLSDLDYYDPQFGNLIREGLLLNYTISGHDTADYSVRHDPVLFARRRDSLSALNIKKILDADEHAKIIVHCGYSHGDECPNPEVGMRLASQIRELTGIDPVTINQTRFMEKDLSIQHPLLYYKQPAGPVAVRFDNGSYKTPCSDISICHPSTRFVKGRPDWMLREGKKYYSPRKFLKKGKAYLIKAYHLEENAVNAIPADVIETVAGHPAPSLIVGPGNYKLVIREKDGAEHMIPVKIRK